MAVLQGLLRTAIARYLSLCNIISRLLPHSEEDKNACESANIYVKATNNVDLSFAQQILTNCIHCTAYPKTRIDFNIEVVEASSHIVPYIINLSMLLLIKAGVQIKSIYATSYIV
jgi:ribonuclease PH